MMIQPVTPHLTRKQVTSMLVNRQMSADYAMPTAPPMLVLSMWRLALQTSRAVDHRVREELPDKEREPAEAEVPDGRGCCFQKLRVRPGGSRQLFLFRNALALDYRLTMQPGSMGIREKYPNP